MARAVIFYVVVLVTDILIGTSFIVWKCAIQENESECTLATAGTLGSVGIWLMLLLACPFVLTKFDHLEVWRKLSEKYKDVLFRLRPTKYREINIQSEIYLPTTLSFRGKGYLMTPCDQGKMAAHLPESEKTVHHFTSPEAADLASSHPDVVCTYSRENGSFVRVPLLKTVDSEEI